MSRIVRALKEGARGDVASMEMRVRSGPVMDDGGVYGIRLSALDIASGARCTCDFDADVSSE